MKKLLVAVIFLGFISSAPAQIQRKTLDSMEHTLSRLRFHLDEMLHTQRLADQKAQLEMKQVGIDSAQFWELCKEIRPDIWGKRKQILHMDSMYYVFKADLRAKKFQYEIDSLTNQKWGLINPDIKATNNTYLESFKGRYIQLDSLRPIQFDTVKVWFLIQNVKSGATRSVKGYTIGSRNVDNKFKPLKEDWSVWQIKPRND